MAEPRILFIARSCNVTGMVENLRARSDTWYVREKGGQPIPEGMKELTLRAAFELRRAVRAGKYDLVVTFSNPDPIWRQDRNAASNSLKFLRKLTRQPSSLGFYLVPWIMGESHVPLAVYDWEDNTIIPRKNWGLLKRATCYFKTQAPRNPFKAFLFQDKRNDCLFNIMRQPVYAAWADKLRPISIGVTEPQKAIGLSGIEKKTDVFFAGAAYYSWARREGLQQLEALRAQGFKIDLHVTDAGAPGLPPDEFLRHCAEAWLVWSPEGAGWDCMRHYWAPLMGSVPLLNHPDTRRHEPLIDGIHAFYYGVEGDDLQRVVKLALADKAKLRTMATEAEAFVRPRHTHGPLTEYLIRETLSNARAGKT